jgi:hypothetical protein
MQKKKEDRGERVGGTESRRGEVREKDGGGERDGERAKEG